MVAIFRDDRRAERVGVDYERSGMYLQQCRHGIVSVGWAEQLRDTLGKTLACGVESFDLADLAALLDRHRCGLTFGTNVDDVAVAVFPHRGTNQIRHFAGTGRPV